MIISRRSSFVISFAINVDPASRSPAYRVDLSVYQDALRIRQPPSEDAAGFTPNIPRHFQRIRHPEEKQHHRGMFMVKVSEIIFLFQRIRNLRTGEPEFEDRPLPAGEHPLEYFITDYTVIMDSFAAPCREGRLPEEEVNWLVEAKGTPKRGSEKVQRVTRRPAGLFGHLECLSPSTTSYPQPVEAYLAK